MVQFLLTPLRRSQRHRQESRICEGVPVERDDAQRWVDCGPRRKVICKNEG